MSSPKSRKQTPVKAAAAEEEVAVVKSPAKSTPRSARKTPVRSRSHTPAKPSRQATPKRTPAKSPAKSPKPKAEEEADCECDSDCEREPCASSPGKRQRSSSGTPSPTKKSKVAKKSTMAETSSEGKTYLASTDIPTHGKATRKAKQAKKDRRSK